MIRPSFPRMALAVLLSFPLFPLTVAASWPFGGSLYTSRFPDAYSPSYYGYNIDDSNPGYYGGGRYREYYSFGRGFGLAGFPGPLPYYPYHGPVISYHVPTYPFVLSEKSIASPTAVAHLEVGVPPEAEVWLEGQKTKQTGPTRLFVTPALAEGRRYAYEIRAHWKEDGKDMEHSQLVAVGAGDRIHVTFPPPAETEILPTPTLQPVKRP